MLPYFNIFPIGVAFHRRIWLLGLLLLLLPSCGKPDRSVEQPEISISQNELEVESGTKKSGPPSKNQTARIRKSGDSLNQLAKGIRSAPSNERAKILADISAKVDPGDLLDILYEGQGLIDVNILAQASITEHLQRAGETKLIEFCNEIADDASRGYVYRRVISELVHNKDPMAIKEYLRLIPNLRLRGQFLGATYEAKLRRDISGTMALLADVKSLLNAPTGPSISNQFVADVLSTLPPSKVDEAWQSLSLVHDPSARVIAAQMIFGALYEKDPLEATSWLRELPASKDKNSSVRYLVTRLRTEGDLDSALAWENSIR